MYSQVFNISLSTEAEVTLPREECAGANSSLESENCDRNVRSSTPVEEVYFGYKCIISIVGV